MLIIWTVSEKELLAFHQRFNQFHPTINLTLNHSYSHINFLDTTIYIKNGTKPTSLYQKPTGHPAYRINRCETCKYILCKDQVAIPNTQKVYTILDYYPCASSNVVYMIICTRCSTGQKLCTRLNYHRHKINTKSCDTPVGQHFCSQNHSLQDTGLNSKREL
ncbi:hypothetical protein XELAEV_18033798mg [Xenopus laevis]|uniref:Uncharacterized protein n=1 Tax=Xenopus laevis TaxID=8355 RepID=A0A974CLJ2_XENLA|nr:hypothetical protein XELAEV_18033798mg [Xenopus laevis]